MPREPVQPPMHAHTRQVPRVREQQICASSLCSGGPMFEPHAQRRTVTAGQLAGNAVVCHLAGTVASTEPSQSTECMTAGL